MQMLCYLDENKGQLTFLQFIAIQIQMPALQ